MSAAVKGKTVDDVRELLATFKGMLSVGDEGEHDPSVEPTPVNLRSLGELAALLGGSILIETIFTIPGMGQYLFDSIASRDYPAIQAIVLVASTIVLLMNVLVDIAYARVDARVSYD